MRHKGEGKEREAACSGPQILENSASERGIDMVFCVFICFVY